MTSAAGISAWMQVMNSTPADSAGSFWGDAGARSPQAPAASKKERDAKKQKRQAQRRARSKTKKRK